MRSERPTTAPWCALLLGVLACAEEPAPPPPCEPGERAALSYAHEDLLCVQLEMDAEDFEALGRQLRFEGEVDDQLTGLIEHVLASCTEPFPDPYTYFPGDLVIDGLEAAAVGVRKKGFIGSTWSPSRPSLKIKTDVYVDGQDLADGTERVTLNNNLSDFTRMRTCMVYSVFADAGYPAPRCNLASVSVNGEPLGVYSHVEDIKKDFLERAFGNRGGSLYEATAADFTDVFLADGLGRWEAKTDDTEPSTALLQGVADALKAPDEELEQALDEVVDLEQLFRFWALETLISHADGYGANTNNFYVYFDPDNGDRAVFIPWGPDDAMTAGGLGIPGGSNGVGESYVRGELARRLSRHPGLSQRYHDALQALLDGVWDEERLLARVAVFDAHVLAAEAESEAHTEAVDALEAYIEGRRAEIEQLIEDGGVEGAEEPTDCAAIIELLVFEDMGELTGTVGQSCASRPGRARGAWAAGLLALVALWRRRREGVAPS